jgi:type IV secretion system protein VirB9
MRLLALLLLTFPVALAAQLPGALDFDSRDEILEWRQDADLPLRTTAGGSLTVIFAPGEAVQSVLVGDPGAVEVKVAPQADSMLVRTLRTPANGSIEVRTQLRDYRFVLRAGPANDVAYAVRFAISAPAGEAPDVRFPPEGKINAYTLKGEIALQPVRVSDDSNRTYIEWDADQALPAVFAINALGQEEVVDGYMRQGVMVIDRIYPHLIFRIGKLKAQASHTASSKAK